MDEAPTTYAAEPTRRRHSRLASGPGQSVSPALRRRSSATSIQSHAMSDSDQSEILAPIPRRHINPEGLRWMQTPSPEPSIRSSSPRTYNFPTKRAHRYSSFAIEPSAGIMQRTVSDSKESKEADKGLARRWLRWMHKDGLKSWILPCILLATTWLKWSISLGSYSGKGTPPLFGDYEAQRHWMELTIHLPVKQWYTYDLQYWGLDYPPLTAYVSWLCGKLGSWINPLWFALDQSRGIEDQNSKVFMRSTVLFFDLIYVLAVIMLVRSGQSKRSTRTQNVTLITLLAQPALLLIDHGHFQYNSVMLGFTLLSLNYLSTGHDIAAALFFVASLGFKQMALYYAPAIGSYLLAKCVYLGPSQGRRLFIKLAITTSVAFLILFLPFLPPFSSYRTILDPISRIFPFSRGLFEDKVANFWCFSNIAVKWRYRASPEALVKLSTVLTAVGFLPSVFGLLKCGRDLQLTVGKTSTGPGPLLPLLKYALLTSSFSFFLFSFQVHEKTILVPLLPLTLIMVDATHDSTAWELGMLGNNVAVFSMWPLLKRDGLAVQYVAMLVLWNALLGYSPFRKPKTLLRFISLAVTLASLGLHTLEFIIPPPARYPDIYPVLNVIISTPVFALIWLWSIKCGLEVTWALGGIGGKAQDSSDWQRERERRVSSVSRGRGVEGLSTPNSPRASLMDRERDGTDRMRQQSLGVANARKRLASVNFRAPSTTPSLDLDPNMLGEVEEALRTR